MEEQAHYARKEEKTKIYSKIRRIAQENDCDEEFLNNFDAVYTFMYEAIHDLPTMKQLLIVIEAMTVGTKAQKTQIYFLLANKLKPKIIDK